MNASYPKTQKNLAILLSNSYVLLTKTQNYHWHVTGPNFSSLHGLFEEQYRDLFEAIDTIAERIRALGGMAPASLVQFLEHATLVEGDASLSANLMVKDLLESHEKLIDDLKKAISVSSDEGEFVSEGLYTERLEVHEKSAWMLRMSLI